MNKRNLTSFLVLLQLFSAVPVLADGPSPSKQAKEIAQLRTEAQQNRDLGHELTGAGLGGLLTVIGVGFAHFKLSQMSYARAEEIGTVMRRAPRNAPGFGAMFYLFGTAFSVESLAIGLSSLSDARKLDRKIADSKLTDLKVLKSEIQPSSQGPVFTTAAAIK